MSSPKIYYENGKVTVTSEKVTTQEGRTFIISKISKADYISLEFGILWKIGFVLLGLFMGFLATQANPITEQWLQLFFGLAFIGFIAAGIGFSTSYTAGLTSDGVEETVFVSKKSDEEPKKIVDAINEALLDFEKIGLSEKPDKQKPIDSSEEIMKLKGLLDAGAITQEEFDLKKKELLGL